MAKRDYYEVLGVGKTAAPDEIKAAYRREAIKHHPDKNPGNKEAEEKFKALNEAYSVLADAEKRKAYDQFGHAGVEGAAGGVRGGGNPFEGMGGLGDIFGDIFEEAFGMGGGRRRAGGGQSGRDLRVDKEVTLNEVVTGIDVTLDVPNLTSCDVCGGSGAKPGTGRRKCADCGGRGQVRVSQGFFTMAQTCPRCRGYGEIIESPCANCSGSGRVQRNRKVKVRIPPGVENGTTLRVTGAGEAGERGGSAGDLYVVIRVAADKRFERDGANLATDVKISFPMAALGGEITVASLDGPVTLKIPAGTQPGVHFRLANHGLPHLRGRSKGDLFVRIQVDVPKKLSKEERKLILDLAARLGDNGVSKDEGVFKRVFGA
jgi:molecular chaperone DnaJ